jgi:hypothetical protein
MKREHRKKSEGRRESAFSFVLKREPLVKQIYALSRELGVRVYLVGGPRTMTSPSKEMLRVL